MLQNNIKSVIVPMPEWEATQRDLKKFREEADNFRTQEGTLKIFESYYSSIRVKYVGPNEAISDLAKSLNASREACRLVEIEYGKLVRKVEALKKRGLFSRIFNLGV